LTLQASDLSLFQAESRRSASSSHTHKNDSDNEGGL
jgi:hypothetical protein